MNKEKFFQFCEEFEALRFKYGIEKMVAVELDNGTPVQGPYFASPENAPENELWVGFSLRGENGCPCCIEKESDAH